MLQHIIDDNFVIYCYKMVCIILLLYGCYALLRFALPWHTLCWIGLTIIIIIIIIQHYIICLALGSW